MSNTNSTALLAAGATGLAAGAALYALAQRLQKLAPDALVLPSTAQQHPRGVWTAIWIMGNLARDVYPASVESVWPFTYDECQCPGPDAEYGLAQKISKCDFHDGRYGLNHYQGRGAPELDLLETIMCSRQMTAHLAQNLSAKANDTCLISSLQLAPRPW